MSGKNPENNLEESALWKEKELRRLIRSLSGQIGEVERLFEEAVHIDFPEQVDDDSEEIADRLRMGTINSLLERVGNNQRDYERRMSEKTVEAEEAMRKLRNTIADIRTFDPKYVGDWLKAREEKKTKESKEITIPKIVYGNKTGGNSFEIRIPIAARELLKINEKTAFLPKVEQPNRLILEKVDDPKSALESARRSGNLAVVKKVTRIETQAPEEAEREKIRAR